MSYRLKREESVSDGIVRIIDERLARTLKQLSGEGEDDREAAVHAVRKDLKKSRSALRLVRSSLGEKRYRSANHDLRGAGRCLSQARDATVTRQTLAGLREHFGSDTGIYAEQAIAVWIKELNGRDGAAEDLESQIEQSVALIEGVRSDVESWRFKNKGWRALSPGLVRAYSRGRDARSAVREDATDEAVHEWRKRVKDLWYQLRLVRKSWPGPLAEAVDQSHDLADLLGDHHDLSLLRPGLEDRELLAPGPAEALAGLIERRQAELLEEAMPLAERLYAEKPKAFERRMHAYWSAWRG